MVRVRQLPDEAGLADARFSHDRYDLPLSSACGFQSVAKLLHLGGTPDEPR
jgi:hypothetical protein